MRHTKDWGPCHGLFRDHLNPWSLRGAYDALAPVSSIPALQRREDGLAGCGLGWVWNRDPAPDRFWGAFFVHDVSPRDRFKHQETAARGAVGAGRCARSRSKVGWNRLLSFPSVPKPTPEAQKQPRSAEPNGHRGVPGFATGAAEISESNQPGPPEQGERPTGLATRDFGRFSRAGQCRQVRPGVRPCFASCPSPLNSAVILMMILTLLAALLK